MSGITNNAGSRTGLVGQTEGGIDYSTMFHVYMSSGPTVTHVTWTLIPLNTIITDIGTNFEVGSVYKYTIPSSGYYHIMYQVMCYMPDGNNFHTRVYWNGTGGDIIQSQAQRTEKMADYATRTLNGSYTSYFTVGDYIQLYGYVEEAGVGATTFYENVNTTFMSGYKISN